MKKYLMTGIAALAMCFGFTSCSHDVEPVSQEDLNKFEAQKIVDNYNQAFIKTFGQPAANQDWGFGSRSITRTADTNSNEWKAKGYNVPGPITDREKEVVMDWFRTHENPQSETVDLHNYFIQNVGYTDHTYPGEGVVLKDNNGHNVTITNPGRTQMDYIFVGPGYYQNYGMTEPARIPYDDGDDHVNNFNAGSGEIQHIMYSGSEYFGFHDSFGNGSSTAGHGNNGKYCEVNRNFVIRYIDVDGEIGCYVGFNYESGKTSEGWHLDPDGFFDDRVIKLVPGEGTITPPPSEWDIRVIAEDLNASATTDKVNSDWDFNDVVFDVKFLDTPVDGKNVKIRIVAAGGTYPLYVAGQEVHALFEQNTDVMINTNASAYGKHYETTELPIFYVYDANAESTNGKSIAVTVDMGNGPIEMTAEVGKPAAKIGVSPNFNYCMERVDITTQYPLFNQWVTTATPATGWWNSTITGQ